MKAKARAPRRPKAPLPGSPAMATIKDDAIRGTMTIRINRMKSVPSGSRTSALGPTTAPTHTPATRPSATRVWMLKVGAERYVKEVWLAWPNRSKAR